MSNPLLIYTPELLLHFDGAAGSTTLIDSSPNNVALVCTGGVAIETSTVLFGSGALNCNDNGGVTGTITTNGPLDLSTGDFTLEFSIWTTQGADDNIFFTMGTPNSNGIWLEFNGFAQPNITFYSQAGQYFAGQSFSLTTGAWNSFALVRNGNYMQGFLNGVGGYVYLCTGSHHMSGLPIVFGQNISAYIDELRITKHALYTTASSPSYTTATAPFSYIGPITASNGDITDPYAWADTSGNAPPAVYTGDGGGLTPTGETGDGRYYWTGNASGANQGPIGFIGGYDFLIDTASLQWTITQAASDGSSPVIYYSTDGVNYTAVPIGSAGTLQSVINESGQVLVPLSTPVLYLAVQSTGGTVTTGASNWVVGLAITRNVNESIPWDYANPFNPVSYNAACMDNSVPTDTLADLRQRILIRLGFASSSANPPPGMTLLVNDFLESAQTYLYRRYKQLHTTRLFRWKVNPGQRFYSLKDNDEDAMCNFNMDPNKKIEWAGIQDSRNVWYPLVQGIPPQLYTMINKPWRPARYEIRQAIEVYPTPDQTYWMWFKGHFGLMAFTLDTNSTTLDSELVFLHALANAKAHYGQPDANNIEAQANAYRQELIAGTHQTASYIPGTVAVPPAVRPTLIQYQDNQSG